MKKILVCLMIVVIIFTCTSCGEPDFSFGDYRIIGFSKNEIIKLDVGAYQTTVSSVSEEFTIYHPAEILVSKLDHSNDEEDMKVYLLKLKNKSETTFELNDFLFRNNKKPS